VRVIELLGIVETGADRSPSLPANPQRTILLQQFEELLIRIRVVDPALVPIVLDPIFLESILAVKKQPADSFAPIARLGVLAPLEGPNVIEYSILQNDTKFMLPGRFVYDAWLRRIGGDNDPIIRLAAFELEPTVAVPGIPITPSPPTPPGPLTPAAHQALHQLIHFINTGPAKGFISGAFRETLPAGNPFPTSITWWTSSAKTAKIVEKLITRGALSLPVAITWNMYDDTGLSVIETTTDMISYSGVFETSRMRSIA
jgi:hypothetical protein